MVISAILVALSIFNLNTHAVVFFNRWPSMRDCNFPYQFLPEIASFGHCCANYDQINLSRS